MDMKCVVWNFISLVLKDGNLIMYILLFEFDGNWPPQHFPDSEWHTLTNHALILVCPCPVWVRLRADLIMSNVYKSSLALEKQSGPNGQMSFTKLMSHATSMFIVTSSWWIGLLHWLSSNLTSLGHSHCVHWALQNNIHGTAQRINPKHMGPWLRLFAHSQLSMNIQCNKLALIPVPTGRFWSI